MCIRDSYNFGQILTFFGAPVSTPFYWWGPNLVCHSRPTVYSYVPNFVSIGLFCRPLAAKNLHFLPIFAIFWTSAFSDVANWHQSQKGEHGCTTTKLPLSNGIKIVFVLQRLHGESGRTTSDVQKCGDQSNRQTDKKLSVFGCPGGGWNPSPTKLGMMIEDLEHVLSPLKRFVVWRIVSPLGGTENLGETRHPQLKTPRTL